MSEAVEQGRDPDYGQVELAEPGTCVAVVCPDSAVDAGYFAAGLARRLVGKDVPHLRAGGRGSVVLVDGLAGAGGLDVIADLERAPGARCAALRGAAGSIDVDRLLRALPYRDGVAVLSHDRACDVVEPDVRRRTVRALGDAARWVVATQPPDRLVEEPFSAVVLLLRGSVPGLVAAQRYVEQLSGEVPVAVVALEMPSASRAVVSDSLGQPLVSASPTRWKLPQSVGSEVTAGLWPGSRDRVMDKLLDDVAVYLRSRGRSAAWV